MDQPTAIRRELAPFSYERVRRDHRSRLVSGVLVFVILLIAAGASLIHFSNEASDRFADISAGVFTGLVIGLVIYFLDSMRELAGRRLEIASLVHNSTSLRGLDLTGGDLRGLYLGDKDLCKAKLENANCQAVVFCDSDLRGINLRNADLAGADLTGADLRGAALEGADLSEAMMTRARLDGARFAKANLRGAILAEATMVKADLTDAVADGASLRQANLTHAKLQRTSLQGAVMAHARLVNAILIGTRLAGANLSYVDFSDAIMIQIDTRDADLRYANLSPQTLRRTTLTSAANVDGATVSADMRGVVGDAASLGTNISFTGSTVPLDTLGSLDVSHVGQKIVRAPTSLRFQPSDELG